ncbi:1930_t:CDS:2 [Entrophospora sp. SA101]|nr:1124_t:CDS:2 [Entrophospora sp. SA101]CAJ0746277.1 1930_t:CDS:2 [Entrophospora sp. SA101]CAJ0839327.1 7331_t:CDS:2 [Entrophospora sp. SA101]
MNNIIIGFINIVYKTTPLISLAAIIICAVDILLRAMKKSQALAFIAGGSYLIMGFMVVMICLYRFFTVRNALTSIPKSKLPISKEYLSKSVNNLITNELNHVSMIAWSGEPRPEDNGQIGWGCPGSSYENIHFQTSIVDTFGLIEQAALKHSLSLKRHPTMSVKRYIDFLIESKVIDDTLGHAYVERYEWARFSNDEIPEEKYREFMKIVLRLLRQLDYSAE